MDNNFVCYFCNEEIRNETEMGHTSICGSVLIPCPNKCGSYIPRFELSSHKKECLNNRNRTQRPQITTQPNVQSLDRKLPNLDVDKLKHESELLKEWKKSVDFKLDSLKQSMNSCERLNSETEIHWMRLQQKMMLLDRIQIDMNILKDSFGNEAKYTHQTNNEIFSQLNHLQGVFGSESAKSDNLFQDQNRVIEEMYTEIAELKRLMEELKAKHTSISFDVKTVNHISSEASERVEIQERQFGVMSQEMQQLRLDLEILEGLAAGEFGFGAPSTSTGRIIWKITDFQAKLQQAKSSNTILKSQTFYTHDFGYRIRVLLHLNGLKKWKDRYALISIHVLNGDFDELLKWPCFIEGNISLRDVETLENPKTFSKYITAKRQSGDEDSDEPQESSSSYIFIPHSILTKSCYLKNDAFFLDVKIQQERRETETLI